MPQMAPMNWLILFMFFLISFILMSNLIYFIYLKNINTIFKKKKMSKNYNKFI